MGLVNPELPLPCHPNTDHHVLACGRSFFGGDAVGAYLRQTHSEISRLLDHNLILFAQRTT